VNCADNKFIFEQYTTCILEALNPASFQTGDRFTDKETGTEWEVVEPMGSGNIASKGLYLDPADTARAGRSDVASDYDMLVKKAGGDDPPVVRNVISKDPTSGQTTAHDWIDPNSYKSRSSISSGEREATAGDKEAVAKEKEEEDQALWARVANAVLTGQPAAKKGLLKGISLGSGVKGGIGSKDWVTAGAVDLLGNVISKVGKKAPKRGGGAVGYV